METTNRDRQKSVCFSGHRCIPYDIRDELQYRISEEIIRSYAHGYRYFYVGMALGFDLLAAEAAVSVRHSLPELQVIAVVPFRNQTERWSIPMRLKYEAILSQVDEVIVLSEQYYNGCLLRRNDYMTNHSSRLIAYYDGQPKGGTYYTYHRAVRQGLDVVNLFTK